MNGHPRTSRSLAVLAVGLASVVAAGTLLAAPSAPTTGGAAKVPLAAPAAAPHLPRPATHTSETATSAPHPAAALPRTMLRRHRGFVDADPGVAYVANDTGFHASGRTHLPPPTKARAWVVFDVDTGAVLGAHRAHQHLPQASTIKLLSALVAAETVPVDVQHRVTRFESQQLCSCAGLRVGRAYTRYSMLAGMLLPSGNDAAEALAGSHPGGRAAFIAAMNHKARDLGADDTVARNPSGLTATGAHSSAHDLAIFLRAALDDGVVAKFLTLHEAWVETTAEDARRTPGHLGTRDPTSGRRPADHHPVWHRTPYVRLYPGSAGKSGYTTPAQNTLVVSTPIEGHRIGVALLGSPGHVTTGARNLTMWAANNYRTLRPLDELPTQ
jgi:D-alanyl-D-alanine carboxypeptidase (penicillin-binding protein 5/6)